MTIIVAYQNRTSYFKRGAQPLVSTFEGPGKAAEWIQIKKDTGAYFMPDWSSKGAKDALTLGGGVVDGLFSWAAWVSSISILKATPIPNKKV